MDFLTLSPILCTFLKMFAFLKQRVLKFWKKMSEQWKAKNGDHFLRKQYWDKHPNIPALHFLDIVNCYSLLSED